MWFEGIEKKLEIVLQSSHRALRQNKTCWQDVVRACGAKIIGYTTTKEMDAYLLSESSLFVWDDRILMITCGKTRLIDSVFSVLKYVPSQKILQLFYERKNLMFPKEQCSDFEADVAKLSEVFPGKSFRFGAANAEHIHVFVYGEPIKNSAQDSTLQILMSNVGNRATVAFSKNTKSTEASISWRQELFKPFFEMIKEEFYFSPQGYSCNFVQKDQYMTMHVSPQSESSYTSFEMNLVHTTKKNIIKTVLQSFEPQNVFMAVTTTLDSISMIAHEQICVPQGYKIVGRGMYEFENGYMLTYINLIQL